MTTSPTTSSATPALVTKALMLASALGLGVFAGLLVVLAPPPPAPDDVTFPTRGFSKGEVLVAGLAGGLLVMTSLYFALVAPRLRARAMASGQTGPLLARSLVAWALFLLLGLTGLLALAGLGERVLGSILVLGAMAGLVSVLPPSRVPSAPDGHSDKRLNR